MGDIPADPEEAAMAILEPSSSLTLRVFYLRLSRCEVDESKLDTLTVTHIPLTPDTVLEATDNGDQQPTPSIIGTDDDKRGVSCPLRPDRVDLKAEQATFASAATVRIASSGRVRFEVRSGAERLLVGILETCDVEERLLFGDVRAATEKRGGGRRRSWVMKCQAAPQRGSSGFLRRGGGAAATTTKAPPTVEVCVAGVVRRTPVVFTRAVQLRFRTPRLVKAVMDPIPECAEMPEQEEGAKETAQEHDTEETEYRCYKPDPEDDEIFYKGSPGRDDEYSELSWFSAGVRVGVGIGLGICLGVGIGAGLLACSYRSTSRTLTRRFISNLL